MTRTPLYDAMSHVLRITFCSRAKIFWMIFGHPLKVLGGEF